jgi:hypothetical protein
VGRGVAGFPFGVMRMWMIVIHGLR